MTATNLDDIVHAIPQTFSGSYAQARQKFRAAAPSAVAYPISEKGPAGESLTTEAAYFGDPKARKLLVIISGTHGLEGYCGSAAQLLFLKAGLHKKLPPSTG